MHVIGITGGICSGKSTATALLSNIKRDYKIAVIDADKLGHQTYAVGSSCYHKLTQHFGDAIVSESGEINRKALGSIVFSDPLKMKDLQQIVWPEIRSLLKQNIDEYRADGSIALIIVEAAVMIEAGWQDLMDTVWVFTVKLELAIQRLMQRNSLSFDDAEKRVASQLNNDARCEYADYVIDNSFDDSSATGCGMTMLEDSIMKTFQKFERERLCVQSLVT